MSELVPKNLWVTLTVVLPGAATYGSWRLLLLSRSAWRLELETLEAIDGSVFLSTCVVAAIALVQQAVGILIEPLCMGLCLLTGSRHSGWSRLFFGRFTMMATEKVSEATGRTVAQFFLSVNLFFGQLMIVAYFLVFEGVSAAEGFAFLLYAIAAALGLTALVRAFNARSVIVALPLR